MTDAGPAERIADLGKKLFDKKKLKAQLEEQVKALEAEIKKIATIDLPKLMEDSGVSKLSLDGYGTLYLSNDFYASVLKDDRPKLYEWMRANGHGDIVQDYVFPQTLTAFAKEQIERNAAMPEVLKFSHVPTAKTRKAS